MGSEDIAPLRTFAAAFEPVSFGERYQQQHTSQLTPLTNFVDAVRPDPPIRHQIELATRALLMNPVQQSGSAAQGRDFLITFFREERVSVPPVQELIKGSPRLAAMQERAQQLVGLSEIGEHAVDYLSKGEKAPAGWKAASLLQVEAAKKRSAIVRFTFLDPLTELINANKE